MNIHDTVEKRGHLDGERDKEAGTKTYEPLANIVWGKNVVEWLYEIAEDPDDEMLNNLCDVYCDAYRTSVKTW